MSIEHAIKSQRALFVQQKKNWAEIIVDFETANRYAVMDEQKNILGMVAENGSGFFHIIKRWIFRSHRGFEASVVDNNGQVILSLARSFFFFFSDLFVTCGDSKVGSIHRRFGIINKKYDLRGPNGETFATIKSPIWRLWTFPVLDVKGIHKDASISKKWGGALQEVFTDADTFRVDFGNGHFTADQRALIFAAAISIDFDFFEKNQGVQGATDLFN